MNGLTVTCHDTATGPVHGFAGELNATNAAHALAAIHALALSPGRQLVLDLTRLKFCDSSGIATLIAARNVTVAAGAGIALAAVPPHLVRTLGLVGLAEIFPVYPTARDAGEAWTQGVQEP